VVQQGNEALYVRLKEEVVLQWLQNLNCPDMFALKEGERLGAGILSVARSMGPFLDGLPETDSPPAYFYVYTLLHSYAHLLMKYVSEYSGLDLGSLGEYIFPADLSFVVLPKRDHHGLGKSFGSVAQFGQLYAVGNAWSQGHALWHRLTVHPSRWSLPGLHHGARDFVRSWQQTPVSVRSSVRGRAASIRYA
jgi:hypothetical protein